MNRKCSGPLPAKEKMQMFAPSATAFGRIMTLPLQGCKGGAGGLSEALLNAGGAKEAV